MLLNRKFVCCLYFVVDLFSSFSDVFFESSESHHFYFFHFFFDYVFVCIYIFRTDLTPEQVVEQTLLRQCIENALAAELLPLERDVVRLRHGLDDGKSRTVKEVMQCSGGMLSVGDVRNLEQRAYKKLRFKHSVHAARLREFSEDYMGVSPELLEVY